MKTTWLKCRQCGCKIHKKTHPGGPNCQQCNLKEGKKRKKGYVENKAHPSHNRKQR